MAHDADDVARFVRDISPEQARRIGQAAYRRVLADHTYAQRAAQFEQALEAVPA